MKRRRKILKPIDDGLVNFRHKLVCSTTAVKYAIYCMIFSGKPIYRDDPSYWWADEVRKKRREKCIPYQTSNHTKKEDNT